MTIKLLVAWSELQKWILGFTLQLKLLMYLLPYIPTHVSVITYEVTLMSLEQDTEFA